MARLLARPAAFGKTTEVPQTAMPRGSKPGERRGGRQRATPNKRTVLRERLLAIASANPTAAVHEFLLSLVNDPVLSADTRLAIVRRIFGDDRPGSLAEGSKQRPRGSRPAGEVRETPLAGYDICH
jgi:hypothetical protein